MPIRRSPNEAGHTRPQPGCDQSEQVVAINRNAWSQSIGISGRNQPVRAVYDAALNGRTDEPDPRRRRQGEKRRPSSGLTKKKERRHSTACGVSNKGQGRSVK
jgi:hypothetical protein